MRFFGRSRHEDEPNGGDPPAGEPDAGAPKWAGDALAAAGIRANVRRSGYGGARFEAWAVTVPGDRAIEACEALRSGRAPGWWPVVVGGSEDEARAAEMIEYAEDAAETILDRAAELDVGEALGARRAELDERRLARTP